MKRVLLLTALLALLLALTAGEAAGQPSFSDAEMLASLESDELLAPEALVAQFDHDLALIRAHMPEMSAIHAQCVDPIPGHVVLEMTASALGDFLAGQHAELNQLNAQLGMTTYLASVELGILALDFALPYKPSRLAALYAAIPGVVDGWPEGCAFDHPDRIVLLSAGVYRFRHGWGDCPCGCTFENVWVFQIQAGVVTLVSSYTTDVTAPRMTWGKLKNLYR